MVEAFVAQSNGENAKKYYPKRRLLSDKNKLTSPAQHTQCVPAEGNMVKRRNVQQPAAAVQLTTVASSAHDTHRADRHGPDILKGGREGKKGEL